MIKIIETTYYADGTSKEKSDSYPVNKAQVLKILRKKSPLPTKVIYDLSKTNEAYYELNNHKHKLVIENATED